jgi:ATP-dependent RNA helicase DeaD
MRSYPLRTSSLQALERMEIETPTPVQEQTIPPLLEGRDVIGQACTGSGKTLAFGLPLIERIDPSEKRIQALVLCPTRELAHQVAGVLTELAVGTGIRLVVVFGGRSYGPQEDALRKGAQIVVGTPGRTLDHINRGTMRLDSVRFLVLDEADEMLDRGFAPDVQRILGRTSKERQTALFSATTPQWVLDVSHRYLKDPVVVQIATDEDTAPDIDHVVYEVWGGDKFDVLRRLLDEPDAGTTLVFRRTKRGVRNLAEKLHRLGYAVDQLQGDLQQQQRDRVLKRFRDGKTPILVATNIAARGLDVLHIERVINYELPETHELFTHRVGRTGRMGRSGRAITLMASEDLPMLHEIERGLARKLPRMSVDGKIIQPVATPAFRSRNRRFRGRR